MKIIIITLLAMTLIGCEDKVFEPQTTTVSTPSICAGTNPELDPSKIKFPGIDSVTNITQTSADINWEHIDGLHTYHIIQVTDTDRKIINSVSAPASKFTLTKLLPNTSYTLLVRAIDQRGFLDQNINMVTFRTNGFTRFSNEKSISFKGSQSIILSESKAYQNGNQFSMSMWFKRTRTARDERLFTFHYRSKSSIVLSARLDENKLHLDYSDDATKLSTESVDFDYSSNRSWHHLVVTVNNDKITLYLNAAPKLSFSANLKDFGDHQLHIAAESGNQEAFRGNIDELAIYNEPLSDSDVEEIYNFGKVIDLRNLSSATKLTHWYQMGDHDKDSPSNIEDIIGNDSAIPFNISKRHFVKDAP